MTHDSQFLNEFIENRDEYMTNSDSLNIITHLDSKRVKYSCYRRQKLYFHKEERDITFDVWTLFVLWTDDTMDWWFRAQDVYFGIGYQVNENVSLRELNYCGDDVIEWECLSHLLCALEITETLRVERGLVDAHNNTPRTTFITKTGWEKIQGHLYTKCNKYLPRLESRRPIVYIVTNNHFLVKSYFKVGYSLYETDDLIRNFNSLAPTDDYEYFIVRKYPSVRAHELERCFHKIFSEYRMKGDFFKLSTEQLKHMDTLYGGYETMLNASADEN